jgi:hypothetical protein
MRYDLTLPLSEFQQANCLVKSVLVSGGRVDLKVPGVVTSDAGLLLPDNREYVEDHPECLGVCFGDANSFDIWISPQYSNTSSDIYRDTLLHELCHGNLGLYTHNQRWRRFFGRVLFAYDALVYPISVSSLLEATLNRYTLIGRDESYSKYLERIHEEMDSIEKSAVNERDQVIYLFTKYCAKEVRCPE